MSVWKKQKALIKAAQELMDAMGQDESKDFNRFTSQVDATLKTLNLKLSAPGKKAVLTAVSRYDETARRVVKKKVKLSAAKLEILLNHLGCRQADLPDFGFYPVADKKGEYRTFEPCSDLRDHESVPLQGDIHEFFKAEALPHVPEAWINMDSVKIGYEISFNKYFYRDKPLRSMEAVAQDILDLENRAEELIAEILGLDGVDHD
ncbi:hypothetical protein [Desulfobacter postgatei]|uniref:hypothetical protein n=1 Tax=Desulfobacter postgatei TaxID=2293 RepID=UPI000232C301|nr:hypothetical protein [Desulfobacter postgatei]